MVKFKNRNYSQMEGREELFERERHQEPVAGWLLIALRSPDGVVETGLCMGPPERKAP